MTNAYRTLADLFDLATIGACCFAAYLLGTAMMGGAESVNSDGTAAGMGMLIGLLASGGLSVALIIPFYALLSVFHRLWHRSLRDARRDADTLNEAAF